MERELKTGHVQDIADRFSLDDRRPEQLTDILDGRVAGRNICHACMDSKEGDASCTMAGLLHKKSATYVIAYWSQNKTFADAADYDMTVHEVTVDFILDDLALC